jgi:hypothetical protein
MRQPSYIIDWPIDVHAVLDHVSRRLRSGPLTDELRKEIARSGGSIRKMEPAFVKPPPAIVRRALALHR